MAVQAPKHVGKTDEEAVFRTAPTTLAGAKALLEREQAEREELTYEQKLALDHATHFVRLPPEQASELVEKLKALGGRVTDYYAHKIADILPVDEDDVRAIFAKDRVAPEAEDIDKIIETVHGYL